MKNYQKNKRASKSTYIIIGLLMLGLGSGKYAFDKSNTSSTVQEASQVKVDKNYATLESISNYDGKNKVVTLNENQPEFTKQELDTSGGGWQKLSDLDSQNRVGQANALMTKEMMPKKARESIRTIYPTGWHQKRVSSEDMLYNRSHLIAFQFTGENANAKNLFTGTTELNQNLMRLYEEDISTYIRRTNHMVRYRVTPFFKGRELVPRGVQIEAQSIEDKKIRLNIFIYNIQPGYEIDYLTGYSNKIN